MAVPEDEPMPDRSPTNVSLADRGISPAGPAPTPVPSPPDGGLAAQLPRDVYEEFVDLFYETTCPIPPLGDLQIAKSWKGQGDGDIEFHSPEGRYFLTVLGEPQEQEWRFDSVLESGSGDRTSSLHIESSAADDLSDSQGWCSTGRSVLSDILHITSIGLKWRLMLVVPGEASGLPRQVAQALSGFYVCPPDPRIESLSAHVIGRGVGAQLIEFVSIPPRNYLGVKFEPEQSDWSFRSLNVSGNWSALGPAVSSFSGELIDFTSVCPSESSTHHLEIEAEGGSWTVYAIQVARGEGQ
jgi:hypothetical protein